MNRMGKPRRIKSSTIACVASVEPESTTTISAQSRRLSRHLPMQVASLRQITAALKARASPDGGSEAWMGDRVAGSVRAISASASRGSRADTELQRSDRGEPEARPISGPIVWGWQARHPGPPPFSSPPPRPLAPSGPRHHIAAMVEPPPSPSPAWILDSDSLEQGPGAPSSPNDGALLDDYSRVVSDVVDRVGPTVVRIDVR